MLQVSKLKKLYGSQTLFEDVTFAVQKREKVGLLGRNGHGKSTLFKILLGQEEADEGEIIIPRGYHLGHLPQTIKFTAPTVLEEAVLGLKPDERDQTWKAERILNGLGFSEESLQDSPANFSGGFQLRINLAKLLLSEPDLLLLDEPTNYLDIVSIRWLTRELERWPGELILISHDKDFMESVTTHTMMIHRGKVKKVEGSIDKLYKIIEVDEEVYEKTRVNLEKRREEAQAFIDRFRAQAAKAALVQSRVKELEKMEVREELDPIHSLEFSFVEKPFEAKFLLHAEDITFGYDKEQILIDSLSFSVRKGARIGIIGKNGRGKSTLLKLIAGELKPLKGNIKSHDNAVQGYFGQTNIARLNQNIRVDEEIQNANSSLSRTQVRSICGAMMFSGDKAEKKISVLSGGERSRVLLGKILATPCNLLLLDEPTSHLDISSIEALIHSLKEFSGGILIVTHSEMILREVCDSLIIFSDSGVEYFEGSYDEFLERRGWGDEEGISQQKKKKAEKKDKRKSEDEFNKLDLRLKRKEEEINKASSNGEYDKVERLLKQKSELESLQVTLLEEMEKR